MGIPKGVNKRPPKVVLYLPLEAFMIYEILEHGLRFGNERIK